VKSTSIWIKDFQSVVDNGRNHSVNIDLPDAKGGENAGPTALELCVMSFCGCVSTIFVRVAAKMRVEYTAFHVETFAEQESGAPTITDVHCVLHIHSSCPEDRIERCFETTINNCPVGNLFRQGGVLVTHEILIANS
jgi:uncharacterized OsmC-like protein